MLSVPTPPRFRMTEAPLVQAVAQVHFPIAASLRSLDGIAPLQAALADEFPYMTQEVVQQLSLMIGPAGPAAPTADSASTVVYNFTNDDGWTLSVTVSSASLSVGGQYRGVRDFARRFEVLCTALQAAAGVRRCDRLGVRYLDLVDIDEGSDDWATWFQPQIVGLAHPQLARSGLIASLTESRLQQEVMGALVGLQGPVLGIIRHGVVPAGSMLQGLPPRPIDHPAFLFDMDTFVQSEQPFEPARLATQYVDLHNEIEKVFHWAVTDAGRDRFGYVLTEEADAR